MFIETTLPVIGTFWTKVIDGFFKVKRWKDLKETVTVNCNQDTQAYAV